MTKSETLSDIHQRRFLRRKTAAVLGVHLPSEDELLGGMPFFANVLASDIREYAVRYERQLQRMKKRTPQVEAILAQVQELQINPSLEAIQVLDTLLRDDSDERPWLYYDHRWRCRIYAAALGDELSTLRLATDALALALKGLRFSGGTPFVVRMLQLLGQAASNRDSDHLVKGNWVKMHQMGPPEDAIVKEVLQLLSNAMAAPAAPEEPATEAVLEATVGAPLEETRSSEPAPYTKIVISDIGASYTTEGKRIAKELAHILMQQLPITLVQGIGLIRQTLLDEFPYAGDIIDRLLSPLQDGAPAILPPTVLFGPPGCGKSRFAGRVLSLLQLPSQLVPAGGVSDGTLGGAARHWSSGGMSLPIRLIAEKASASVAIILDEIDKAGISQHNGRLQDALLPFLEPETAKRLTDPYLQAQCDLSSVTWLMTANDPTRLSPPFRDRCSLLRFPEPGAQHLEPLADYILLSLAVQFSP